MWNFLIGEAAQECDGLSEISGVSSAEIITSDGTMKVIGVRNCVSRYINYLFGEMFEVSESIFFFSYIIIQFFFFSKVFAERQN